MDTNNKSKVVKAKKVAKKKNKPAVVNKPVASVEAVVAPKKEVEVKKTAVNPEIDVLKNQLNQAKTQLSKKEKEFKLILDDKTQTIMYLQDNINTTIEENKQVIKTITEEYVPKDKLRSENLVERLNWWYRDLTGWQKVAAHICLAAVMVSLIFGVYSGVINAATGDQLISIGISLVLAIFGLNTQAVLLKEPKVITDTTSTDVVNK
jgi:hypothetical protein